MQISFLRSLISKVPIYDTNNNTTVEAQLCELECSEKSDIDYLENNTEGFVFQSPILYSMQQKYEQVNNLQTIYYCLGDRGTSLKMRIR